MRVTDANPDALAPWGVVYPGAGSDLTGYLFVPGGDGPFPAMIVNPGSGGFAPAVRKVAREPNRFDSAAFLPVRRGYQDNPAPTGAPASPWRTAAPPGGGYSGRSAGLLSTRRCRAFSALSAGACPGVPN